MLEKIKSKYLWLYLFSFIHEKRLLQLINYNKRLQYELGKFLLNYNIWSGKYTIFETNTKGKIYDALTNNLYFEGEFLKGKRNGQGKIYNIFKKTIIFEGGFLNGKKIENVKNMIFFIH